MVHDITIKITETEGGGCVVATGSTTATFNMPAEYIRILLHHELTMDILKIVDSDMLYTVAMQVVDKE